MPPYQNVSTVEHNGSALDSAIHVPVHKGLSEDPDTEAGIQESRQQITTY